MKTFVVAIAVALAPVSVFAQGAGAPPANVRMRIGPLYINPTISLSNAGRDTNVFNDSKNPQEDFTVTISPGTDIWLRFGPAWLQGNIKEDIVWFNKFASERSANNSYNLKAIVPLNRISLAPAYSYVNTRERPGFEIDTRAERSETGYALNIDYRLFTKTFIGIEGRLGKTDFAEGANYRGTDLHTELNRTHTSESVNVRHQITPLTSLIFSAAIEQDRFGLDPLRNSDSRGYAASFRFDPAALLKGSASVGYRHFKPRSPEVPEFAGTTLGVDLSYVLLGITKFGLAASRDVQFSYDINQPYYVQTALGGSIGQQLFGPLDIVARGAVRRLEYRNRAGAVIVSPDRVDHSTTYGAGLGYHLGKDTRIGFNIDHSRRESVVALQQYQGWTYGVAVTYGSGS